MNKENNEKETIKGFSVVTEVGIGERLKSNKEDYDKAIPLLPLRNMFLFPSAILTVSVGRESSLKLVRSVEKSKETIGVFCQRQANIEHPTKEDLFHIGTSAKILKVFETEIYIPDLFLLEHNTDGSGKDRKKWKTEN